MVTVMRLIRGPACGYVAGTYQLALCVRVALRLDRLAIVLGVVHRRLPRPLLDVSYTARWIEQVANLHMRMKQSCLMSPAVAQHPRSRHRCIDTTVTGSRYSRYSDQGIQALVQVQR